MAKYIQDKNGRMAGSIGDGKHNVPQDHSSTSLSTPLAGHGPADRLKAEVDKLLRGLDRARSPHSRREHERFFAAKLARLDTTTPVDAAILQNAYRRADQATTYIDEMTAQRTLVDSVTSILYPGAAHLTFVHRHVDEPHILTITDQAGNTLYDAETAPDASRAAAIESFLGAFHHEATADYFTPTATPAGAGYTHRIGN